MPRKSKKDIDLEDLEDELPKLEPYKVLGIEKTATPDEIKSAYRKSALRHHPDKATEENKSSAHTKFQEIASAYAILSDPIRRKRYDTTGSTAESLEADEDFSLADFISQQFKDIVTSDAIEAFAKSYKNSVEEKDDVLSAYEKGKGKWDKIYEVVMLSNPLEDEDRFRVYIDEAIEKGEVNAFKSYTNESANAKEKRMKAARGEAEEAEELAEELGLKKVKGEDDLMALIRKKNAAQGADFMDRLEAKYGGAPEKKSKSRRGTKRGSEDQDEPSEEAFQAAAKRLKQRKDGGSGEGKKSKRAKV